MSLSTRCRRGLAGDSFRGCRMIGWRMTAAKSPACHALTLRSGACGLPRCMILPDVVKVALQEQNIERIFSVVGNSCLSGWERGRGRDENHSSGSLGVSWRSIHFEPFSARRVCGQAESHKWTFVSFSWPVFLGDKCACLLLVSCWFSTGLHAFVLLRPVRLTPDRTRST